MTGHMNDVHNVKASYQQVLEVYGRSRATEKVAFWNPFPGLRQPVKVLNVRRFRSERGRSHLHYDRLDEQEWRALTAALHWNVSIEQTLLLHANCKSRFLPFGKHLWENVGLTAEEFDRVHQRDRQDTLEM
jgi:hypothetical protein